MSFRQAVRIIALTFLALGAARADNVSELSERLHQASLSSSLDTEGFTRWHLKLDVQLFGEKGKQTETGVIEEWWISPTSFEIAYTFPSYTAVVLHSGTESTRTKEAGTPPALLRTLRQQIVHPMPTEKEIDESQPELRNLALAKVPLECIMLAQKSKMTPLPPLGLFPTYCFDHGKNSLRLSYDVGSQAVVRNKTGAFLARMVTTDFAILESGSQIAGAHIAILESQASIALPPIDPAKMKVIGNNPRIGSRVMAGHLVSKIEPVYPEAARSRHASGAVVLNAVIGADGRIHTLHLDSSPDPDLAMAALAAVRKWTYTPYLLNGDLVDVQTTITVNFNFAH
ncbi:MAG: energy transducer TonB [Acidobacteriota bacterium]|nr:energy transducer TonB [Acidobacteriota bacterium]